MGEIRIRGFTSSDASDFVHLRRVLTPEEVLTPETLIHWYRTAPRRTHRRWWVAREGGRLAGMAIAGFDNWTTEPGIAHLWAGVHPDRRGEGAGSRLYELAESHLLQFEPRKIHTSVREDDPAGARFASKRGFRNTRLSKVWELDPRDVDLSDLSKTVKARRQEGFHLAPLRDLQDRPRDFYDTYIAAARDIPWDHPIDLSFREWKKEIWESPATDFDASTVVMTGDRPVSFASLVVDRDGGRAYHELTGTIPEFRRRGLARLAKMAAIRWCAENGITAIFTDNDSTNSGMLALNEHLGYRPRPAIMEMVRTL